MLDFRFSWCLVISLFSVVTCAAPSNFDVSPRNVSAESTPLDEVTQASSAFPISSEANVTTIKNTTALIRDKNGVDITSSFQIKVYNPPLAKHVTNMSEGNQLNNRQMGGGMSEVVKLVNKCPGENSTFIESHCTPEEDDEMPFQAFVYTCRKVVDHWRYATGEYMGQAPAYRSFHDRCEPSELCVDGFGDRKVASCVHTALFDDYMIDKDGRVKGMLSGEIFDVAKAWAVIMEKDKKNAPLKAKKMGIDTWNSASGPINTKRQRKICHNCVEVETDLLQPQMDSLRLEATLASAGAIGGVLFMAMIAG